MTLAVCTNCGKTKLGAWCPCTMCHSEGLNYELDLLLSDHHLERDEIDAIGFAVERIHKTGLSETNRFFLLAYYLAHKWPKLLAFDEARIDPAVRDEIRQTYHRQLSELQGQDESRHFLSAEFRTRFTRAKEPGSQDADTGWQVRADELLTEGVVCKRKLEALRSTVKGRPVWKRAMGLFWNGPGADAKSPIFQRSSRAVRKTSEYARQVRELCLEVKPGYSARTHSQAENFHSFGERLSSWASMTEALVRHHQEIERLSLRSYWRIHREWAFEQEDLDQLIGLVRRPGFGEGPRPSVRVSSPA